MCWRDIGRPPIRYPRTAPPQPEPRITVFSDDRVYRYTLWREWPMPLLENNHKYVMFIGLNPSTADETKDDPTIRKCVHYAKAWGFGALCMTNLFAFRSTDPRKMKKHPHPVGPDNDKWLKECARKASLLVAAWGRVGAHMRRDLEVERLISNMQCLGQNADGTPKHPLYLSNGLKPTDYWMREPF